MVNIGANCKYMISFPYVELRNWHTTRNLIRDLLTSNYSGLEVISLYSCTHEDSIPFWLLMNTEYLCNVCAMLCETTTCGAACEESYRTAWKTYIKVLHITLVQDWQMSFQNDRSFSLEERHYRILVVACWFLRKNMWPMCSSGYGKYSRPINSPHDIVEFSLNTDYLWTTMKAKNWEVSTCRSELCSQGT